MAFIIHLKKLVGRNKSDIRKWCKACPNCLRNKRSHMKAERLVPSEYYCPTKKGQLMVKGFGRCANNSKESPFWCTDSYVYHKT